MKTKKNTQIPSPKTLDPKTFVNVFEESAEGLFFIDANSKRIRYANQTICYFLQYQFDELRNKKIHDILKLDKRAIDEEIRRIMLTNTPIISERKYQRKDGTSIELETISKYYKDEENNFIAVFARDIGLRKITYHSTRKSELQFRSVWENSFDGMRLVDKNGIIVLVNYAFCNMVGRSKNELIGKPLWVIYDPKIPKQAITSLLKKIKTRSIERNIIDEVVLWNGKKVWYEISNSFIELESGNTQLLSVFRDITKLKNSEITLIEMNTKLQELNSSKDKFFSIIAHDLRSPFQSLLGFTSILSTEAELFPPEQVKLYSSNIHMVATNLYNLIENLLSWSRLSSGKVKVDLKKLNLYEEILKCKLSIIENAKKKGLSIKINVDEGITILADSVMVYSIFQNIISNAIKFSHRNGEIIITAKIIQKNVELTIKDYGVGIQEEELEKIFRLDTQFSTIGTMGEKGTGLGLLICKEMVEKLGGSISIKSIFREGTEVKIIFALFEEILK
jgi:PAS domain S-box-containing protein